ncbi:MAG: UbiA family prenyltransferase [Fluviicola sp.]
MDNLKLICLLIFSISPIFIYSIFRFKTSLELLKDIRIERILHYFVVSAFGFVLFHFENKLKIQLKIPEILEAIIFFFTLFYAAFFAIATNNEADIEIDKISNSNRPLVKNTVNIKEYRIVAYLSLVLSLGISFTLGIHYFLCVFGLSLIYFLYSCKPFRFKKHVLFAKFLIGVNTFLCAVTGFESAGGSYQDFPIFWSFFILVPVALLANFIDLKDVEGDGKNGIQTIPVLFGIKATLQFLSFIIFICYLFVFFYFEIIWFSVILIPLATIHLYLLWRKPYKEKPLFYLHNFLFLGLIVLFLLAQTIGK